MSPLDLHVLGTPPAFVLSQDQTLPFNPLTSFDAFHSLESSLIFPVARFFLLYRFQGSLRSLYDLSQASLSRITKQKRNVKHFLAIFLKKMRNFNASGRCDSSPSKMFLFWPGFQGACGSRSSAFSVSRIRGFFVSI